MEYANAYPCFYGLLGGGATKVNGNYEETIKNGSSWHIGNRKSGALTYFVDAPVFQFVIVIPQDYFHSKDELYVLDAEFVEFIKQKGLGQYYINKGGGTEWFLQSCPTSYLELRKEFLAQKGIPILAIIENDPFPIYDLNMEQKKADEEEQNRIAHAKEISWISMFMRIFFPDGELRSNQWELWQNFLKIAESSSYYAGIVQWPTGTGKTIGMIILLFLSFMSYKKQGKIFRGLLITHKNDILDTLMKKIKLLEKFGITVLDGSNGKFSSLVIPADKNILVIATHASLTEESQILKLPPITHLHYDEVHRITGNELFELIKKFLPFWNTQFLTGTSATPLTSSAEQRKKLAELFGEPPIFLHQVTVEDAVAKRWIAQPRFIPYILTKDLSQEVRITKFLHAIGTTVHDKKSVGKWRDGKIIAYLPTREDVRKAADLAKKHLPNYKVYVAVEDASGAWHSGFVDSQVSPSPQILFACERYREGSDIANLEMTCVLMGNTMATYILIQIAGRALRTDYEGKEGWCMIMRPSDEGITAEEVFDHILLDIWDCLGKQEGVLKKEYIEKFVKTFMGPLVKVGTSSETLTISETVYRLQAMFVRRAINGRSPKEKYNILKNINKDMRIYSKEEYVSRAVEHPKYIDAPKGYFSEWWTCWYDYLGVDTTAFPQTKAEWIHACKEKGIMTWEDYKNKKDLTLPANPSEMYEDFTNWGKEMGIEEEVVW